MGEIDIVSQLVKSRTSLSVPGNIYCDPCEEGENGREMFTNKIKRGKTETKRNKNKIKQTQTRNKLSETLRKNEVEKIFLMRYQRYT